ncbi:MAG: phosphatase PAP2 family protein [Aliidongia sp.]
MLSLVGLTDFGVFGGDAAGRRPDRTLAGAWACLAADGAVVPGVAVLSALVAISKIAFLGWGIGSEALDFTGVSGHAAFAVAILSVGAALSLADRGRRVRWVGTALGAAIGIAIGLSRLVLHVHSPSEVAAGAILGAVLAAIYIWSATYADPAKLRPATLGIVLVLTLATIHGQRAPTQSFLTRVALALSGQTVPHDHADWPPTRSLHPPQVAQRPQETL